MRIAYISFSFIPSRTANSLHVMKMCQAFAANGHEVVLFAPAKKDEYEQNVDDIFSYYQVSRTFKVVRLPFPMIKGKFYVYWLGLMVSIWRYKPHIVYGRYVTGSYLATLLGFRTIFEVHDKVWQRLARDHKHFNSMLKSHNFVRLVAISERLKKAYLEKKKIAASDITVAHDAADIPGHHQALSPWPGRKGKLQVGYVGHLYKGKGIEVIQAVAPALSEVDFHIVGGFDRDIEYWRSKLREDNVYFHGFVPQNMLSYYINAFDICLLPNQKEVHTHGKFVSDIGEFTSPLKMFDYMAHQKTIIASDLPVLKEVLTHKINAWLCQADQPEQWVEALLYLQHNPDIRKAISNQAFKDFNKHYTWEKRASKVLKV